MASGTLSYPGGKSLNELVVRRGAALPDGKEKEMEKKQAEDFIVRLRVTARQDMRTLYARTHVPNDEIEAFILRSYSEEDQQKYLQALEICPNYKR